MNGEAYIIKRSDGSLRVVRPDLDGELPQGVIDIMRQTCDQVLARVPIESLATYTETLCMEVEDVRRWVASQESRRFDKACRLAVLRYQARKAVQRG